MDFIRMGPARVSRFILGSNPFSGFSHQTPVADLAMERYYTSKTIKRMLREAEGLGVDTDSNCADFVTSNRPTPGEANQGLSLSQGPRVSLRPRRPASPRTTLSTTTMTTASSSRP